MRYVLCDKKQGGNILLKKLLFTATLLSSLCIFSAENTAVFNSPKNKIIVSQKMPIFTITLKSNPTTGFSWKLKSYDKGLITYIDHKFVASQNKKLIGAPGYEVWTFKANKANDRVNQVGHVSMEYARPWTKEGAITQSFIIVVKRK